MAQRPDRKFTPIYCPDAHWLPNDCSVVVVSRSDIFVCWVTRIFLWLATDSLTSLNKISFFERSSLALIELWHSFRHPFTGSSRSNYKLSLTCKIAMPESPFLSLCIERHWSMRDCIKLRAVIWHSRIVTYQCGRDSCITYKDCTTFWVNSGGKFISFGGRMYTTRTRDIADWDTCLSDIPYVGTSFFNGHY